MTAVQNLCKQDNELILKLLTLYCMVNYST